MWLIYSIACALSDSIESLTNKKLISKKQDPMSVSLFIHVFGTLAFLVLAVLPSQKRKIIMAALVATHHVDYAHADF